MNATVMDFLRRALPGDEVTGKRIAEIGSMDVNGTPRTVVAPLKPKEYIGCDTGMGRCVDRIVDANFLVKEFGEQSMDVVISTEMLEHVEDWKTPIREMKAILKDNGILALTTRSPGFSYHAFPIDCWRFTQDDFRVIFGDMEILMLESDKAEPGVFVKARKRGNKPADLSSFEVYRMPEYKKKES